MLMLSGMIFLSTSKKDNCAKVGCNICLIKNILVSTTLDVKVLIEINYFSTVQPFFSYSLPSSNLDIHKVSQLSGIINCVSLTEVTKKYVRLPYKDCFVVVPLLK